MDSTATPTRSPQDSQDTSWTPYSLSSPACPTPRNCQVLPCRPVSGLLSLPGPPYSVDGSLLWLQDGKTCSLKTWLVSAHCVPSAGTHQLIGSSRPCEADAIMNPTSQMSTLRPRAPMSVAILCQRPRAGVKMGFKPRQPGFRAIAPGLEAENQGSGIRWVWVASCVTLEIAFIS